MLLRNQWPPAPREALDCIHFVIFHERELLAKKAALKTQEEQQKTELVAVVVADLFCLKP